MSDTQIPLQPDYYFHIYNHAVGDANLFEAEKEYLYFLNKLKQHLLPVSDLLVYCLMPNHFHLVLRLKNSDEIKFIARDRLMDNSSIDELMSNNENYLSNSLSQKYSNFFNAYAKYYNFWHKRNGTLFKRAFRRKRIEDNEYLKKLVCYIHQNPVKAGFVNKPDEWKYSSYKALISSQPSLIPRKEIISLFGDVENLIYCHTNQIEMEC